MPKTYKEWDIFTAKNKFCIVKRNLLNSWICARCIYYHEIHDNTVCDIKGKCPFPPGCFGFPVEEGGV